MIINNSNGRIYTEVKEMGYLLEMEIPDRLLDEIENSIYGTIKYEFVIYTADRKNVVARINGRLFNEKKYDYPYAMVTHADLMGQEEYDNMEVLVNSREFILNRSNEFYFNSWCGYIYNCYVYEEYRNNGIGKFLLNNLHRIVYEYLGMKLRCVVVSVVPFLPVYDENGKESWKRDDYEEGITTEEICEVLLNCGFDYTEEYYKYLCEVQNGDHVEYDEDDEEYIEEPDFIIYLAKRFSYNPILE